ncbi:MAG: MFS transporter [Ilumatobacteraceae bacterium]
MTRASTFRSLRHRNTRLFLSGLAISQIGAWVQFTAVAVLLDRLTESTTAIGILTALQFGPLLLLGAWAGSISDRFDRRRIVLWTQTLLAVQAALFAIAYTAGVLGVGMIYALTLLLGVVSAIDNPARRGFLTQLVDQEEISNVLALNTATMTGSRIFGPAIAALLIGPAGAGWLFVINAVTSIAIIWSIVGVDGAEVRPAPKVTPGGRPVREAVAYIARTPQLGPVFVVFAIVSTFGFNHNVSLPRIASDLWGNETWFGWVMTATSVGSLTGSLLTAGRSRVTLRWMFGHAVLLGVSGVALAYSTSGWMGLVVAVPLGLGGAAFISAMNAWTQDTCPPAMRGRMLAFIAVAFLGSYPIGGPITGVVGDLFGLRLSLLYGAVIVLASAVWLELRVLRGSVLHDPADEPRLSV